MKRRRSISSVGTALLLSLALAGQAHAAVAWSAPKVAGGNYSWNGGYGLARTGTSPVYLHGIYATDFVGGVFASDSGPYQGVYHVRSSDDGASWSSPKRVSQATQHADFPALASASGYVYAVWATVASYDAYDPDAPRVLYFRANSSQGAPAAWGTTRRLSPLGGRIDWPTIAAVGTYVYVTWVDADTGSLKLAISPDRGATWTTKSLGATTRTAASGAGYVGWPAVAAAGANVAVAWLASDGGALKARVSTNYGATWATAITLASAGVDSVYAHALGDRIGVAWSVFLTAVRARIWQAGAWQPLRTVASFSGSGTWTDGYGPAIALVGTSGVGVAWGACRADCTRVDLRWRESSSNGASWAAAATLQSSLDTASRRLNDWPSVVWNGATKRYVLYNSTSEDEVTAYRLRMTVGGGTP